MVIAGVPPATATRTGVRVAATLEAPEQNNIFLN